MSNEYSFITVESKEVTVATNLKMADVNYDGVFTREDADIIEGSLGGNKRNSVLQNRLMDFDGNSVFDLSDIAGEPDADGDGKITLADAQQILRIALKIVQ